MSGIKTLRKPKNEIKKKKDELQEDESSYDSKIRELYVLKYLGTYQNFTQREGSCHEKWQVN